MTNTKVGGSGGNAPSNAPSENGGILPPPIRGANAPSQMPPVPWVGGRPLPDEQFDNWSREAAE